MKNNKKISTETQNGNLDKPMLTVVIDVPQDLLNFLKTKDCSEFTTKDMSVWLKEDLKIKKYKTVKLIQELKELQVIERRSESGNCKTTCASCYEYGCDAGAKAPLNFWKVLRWVV
jgi:hypothetical protein